MDSAARVSLNKISETVRHLGTRRDSDEGRHRRLAQKCYTNVTVVFYLAKLGEEEYKPHPLVFCSCFSLRIERIVS